MNHLIMLYWTFFVFCLYSAAEGVSKQEGDFYPFGHHAGDKSLSPLTEDSTSEEINFPKPVHFFGVRYRSAHANENGLISFETDVPFFQNQDINRFEYSLIAVFYADVDIRNPHNPERPHGHVYYRITEDRELRERATRFVRSKFQDAGEFEARFLLIVTWDEVGYFDGQYDKKNTFQAILISGDIQCYVELLYSDEGIQWTRTRDKNSPGRLTTPAQVGFLSDDNRHRLLDYSGTNDIAHINRRSNIGENGRFLFRVSGDDILGPAEVSRVAGRERLQPLDIGGPSGVVGAGTHSTGLDLEDAEDEDDEYAYDRDIVYDNGQGGHHVVRPADRGGVGRQLAEPSPPAAAQPLEAAPPAPGPDVEEEAASLPPPPISEPELTSSATAVETPDDTADIDSTTSQSEPTTLVVSSPEPRPYRPPLTEDEDDDDEDDGNDAEDTREPPTPPPLPPQGPAPTPEHRPHPPPSPAVPYVPAPVPVAPGPRCAQGGSHLCHRKAECRDYATGSCCECQYGYIGNGKECVKHDDPQRINGRFYGNINGIDISETDLHTYVVTTDGRVYTALSQIPPELGRPLLLLGTIGGVLGWLFGKPTSPSTYNGFALTGGILNRTATVHISDRHTVTIQQDFSGKDNFGYYKTRVYVTGSLPEIPEGVEVDYGDYKEDYTRHAPGIVKSYSSKVITAGNDRYQITIDQTIRYEECPHRQFDKHPTISLHADRSYNVYDPKELMVRYAAANTVELPGDTGPDPCRDGSHDCTGPRMTCARDGQAYRCVCVNGYELTFPREGDRRGVCIDLDECARSLDRCDAEADCLNTDGSYQCVCRPGFRGDGFSCAREVECDGVICDVNAECLPAPTTQLPECVCMVGFEGDGQTCRPPVDPVARRPANGSLDQQEGGIFVPTPSGPTCSSHDQCHRHGQCVYNQAIRQYQCQCRPPYSGDGRHCFLEAESCDRARNCDPNADCVWQLTEIGGGYNCRCRAGYTGDGRQCTRAENPQDVQCNVVNNCHRHALCNFNPAAGRFVCQCTSDYEGDGYSCTLKPRVLSTGDRRCQSVEDCHAYGHCVNQGEDYVCECLPGFKGDGISNCEPSDQCNPGTTTNNQCDVNAACLYDDTELAYICKCKDGYHGDGRVCREGANTCDRNPSLCHRDGQCVYDTASGYTCRCKTGYRGDGIQSCEADRSSCETQNICHPHGQCQRNRAGEYRCVCNSGYEGDGVNCHPAQDCLINQRLCDVNAVCVSENFRYVCRCKPGYHGSGLTCSADSELRGRTLVFTQGVALVQRGLSSDDMGKQIAVVPHQIAVGLDYDCQDDKLFWTDVSGHAIRSSYVQGNDSNVTTLFTEGLNSPEGLVVDWASKNVYYTDSQLDIIGVARQDGKYRLSLVKDGLVNPRGLALDLYDRKLYYSDWYRQKPVIGRLNLDGTGREDFITKEIALPNGLVILHRRRQLCWADAGMQRLECIGLNGSGRRVIYAPLGYPFGLAVHNEETFYWTDWEDTKIHSVSINAGNHHSFPPSIGGSGKLYGIVLISEQCPPGESACAVNNGGCRFICLPDSRGSRSCVCPDNIPESECNDLNGGAVSLL